MAGAKAPAVLFGARPAARASRFLPSGAGRLNSIPTSLACLIRACDVLASSLRH